MANHIERPTQRQVADWLGQLAVLLPVQGTLEDAGQRLRAMIPMLVERYASRDFDASSREFVARHCTVHFPSYGQICDLLDKWPRPVPEQPRHMPEDSDLSATDRAWIAFWHRRRAELFAQQTGFLWASRDADLTNLASLVKQHSPKAWREVSGERPAERQKPTEGEVAYVANLLRPAPEPVRSNLPQPPPPPPPQVKPAPLPDEILAAVRARRTTAMAGS